VDDRLTSVVAVLFPHVAQLDLTGPAQVFAAVDGIKLHLAAASLDPVPTDSGFAIVPTVTFADAPVADVLMVPGGRGVNAAMLDDEVLVFSGSKPCRRGASRRSVRGRWCWGPQGC